ncbi:MAG: DUF1822 family protein [Richelia sp. SM1_7_0]|nr:DUF1822 family protein [Richelia sp. SM1_7_0]NJR16931.1 DUF1822 family protein [Calothrix sp. CSU_2_0]
MFSASFSPFVNSEHLFEIPNESHVFEHLYSTPGATQRASINQQCVDALLRSLQEEISENAKLYFHQASSASIWEFVNGSAINLQFADAIAIDNLRLVLVPTLAMDGDELSVPQEWIDIPEWVGDYYLGVQVNPDEGWVRVYGYTTHNKIKNFGVYNANDRTYSLESEYLIEDLNVLWLSRQFYPQEVTRANIEALPTLHQTQAENLLQRLGNSEIKFPRLEVPFSNWGALISHGDWRQRLYELRQGIIQHTSVWQWFEDGVSQLAQQLGWVQREFSAVSLGMRSQDSQASNQGFSRELLIAGNTYELRVFLKGDVEEQIWRFELRSIKLDSLIPVGFKLRLLTENLQEFANNQDSAIEAVEMLYVEVMLAEGEGLVWEIEPNPEGCDREILRF